MKSECQPKEIVIDGTVYVPVSSAYQKAADLDGLQYVLVRSGQSGVWGGYLKERNFDRVELVNARRCWRFYANECCELAIKGLTKGKDNRISVVQPHVIIFDVCEIHDVTEKARLSIQGIDNLVS